MERIQCVSLPRCGHNLLVSHLQKYFGSHLQCQATPKKRLGLFGSSSTKKPVVEVAGSPFHYCEYYYACRQSPCVHSYNTFQKSHDFELALPVEQKQKYIVQHREPLGLMISWFEMRLRKDRETDSPDGFRAFVDKNSGYLKGFQQKWITSDFSRRLVLDYDDYLQNPIESLSSVVHFFDAHHDVNVDRLAAITIDIKQAKNNNEFRFIETARKCLANLS